MSTVASTELKLTGTVYQRGAEGYEQLRAGGIYNGIKPERFPALIARVANVEDVVAAVNYARENGLKVAVRGSGHNFCGASLRDDSLLIDVADLNNVTVDAVNMTAVADPVVRNGDLIRTLKAQGLSFPAGHCSHVSLSGYLLGGGFGWNIGQWGLACHNVLAVDVVTADGQLLHCDDQHQSDLYWAARGASGGFFGVVVKYYLRLHKDPAVQRASTLVFPAARAAEAAAWMRDIAGQLPPNVEMFGVLASAPPPGQGRVLVVGAAAFCETEEQAVAGLAAFRSCPVPDQLVQNLDYPTTIDELFVHMDGMLPEGKRIAAESMWLAGDAAELIGMSARRLEQAPSAQSSVLCLVVPPPPADAPAPPDTAWSMAGPVGLMTYAVWDDPAEDAANNEWLAQAHAELQPSLLGYYIGESNVAAGSDRSARSFAPQAWERLGELKRKYDSADLFHTYLGGRAAGRRDSADTALFFRP
jgi:FAD/FMN-containing dehydrogenase